MMGQEIIAGKVVMRVEEQDFITRVETAKYNLYKMAYLYMGKEHIAIDIVDEAVFMGFKKIKQLRQPEYFETWLTRIVINLCKKELKRRKKEVLLDTLPETAAEKYDALPLKEAVYCLPPELKAVIILRFFIGYSLKETAASLNIPQGTVVTRQRRALQLLKLDLEEA